MFDTSFTPHDLFVEAVQPAADCPVTEQDVERPQDVPENKQAYTIALGEQLLAFSLSEIGHHSELTRTIQDWATSNEDRDANPGYWVNMAYELGPREVNQWDFEGEQAEQVKKAKTIKAWASEHFEADELQALETELKRDYADRWVTAANEHCEQTRGEAFLLDRPDLVNGWQRIDSPPFSLAYYGADEDGNAEVAMLCYMDGYPRLWRFSVGDYVDEIQGQQTTDTTDLFNHKKRRISNPETFADGGIDLQKYLNSTHGDNRSLVGTLDTPSDPSGDSQPELTAF